MQDGIGGVVAREYKEAHKSHIEAGGGAEEGLEEGKYRMVEGGGGTE